MNNKISLFVLFSIYSLSYAWTLPAPAPEGMMNFQWVGRIYWNHRKPLVGARKHRCITSHSSAENPIQHLTTDYRLPSCSIWTLSGLIQPGFEIEGYSRKFLPYFIGQISTNDGKYCMGYHRYNDNKPSEDRLPVNPTEKSVYGDIRTYPCDRNDINQAMYITLPKDGKDYYIFPADGPMPRTCAPEQEAFWAATIFFGSDWDSRVEVGCGDTAWRFLEGKRNPHEDDLPLITLEDSWY